MVDKAVPDNSGEDEFAQLARKACLIVGRLHDAVHELIDNEIEQAGLPCLPEDATDEINEAILELVTDLIYALPENQNSCLTEGLPRIVELWRKSQNIGLAPGLSHAHLRVVGTSSNLAAPRCRDGGSARSAKHAPTSRSGAARFGDRRSARCGSVPGFLAQGPGHRSSDRAQRCGGAPNLRGVRA